MSIELRDLINGLTQDRQTPVHTLDGITCLRPDPPLLTALADARTSNLGQGSGASTNAARERLTLNIAASELHTAIHDRTRTWARAAGVTRHWASGGTPVDWRDPAALLTAWHLRTLSQARFDPEPYIDTLTGWTHAIHDLVTDPPRRWTINAACPLCQHRWTINPDGHQIDALHVADRNPADTSTITCRNCDHIWHGINGARQLRIAIDDTTRIAS